MRSLLPDEWDSAYGTLLRAFGGPPEAEEERQLWRDLAETRPFPGRLGR
ncbi:GNAT family N-acetyltransferase OS=Streptomyces tendae OX=1932 GN=F3L20_26515 PE=3 SV=1 [Streptomyces tendae]